MTSGSDTASINIVCDTDGNVQFQPPACAGDDWGSGESVTPLVGASLVKTYWFDHLDCDHRELLQLLRKAGTGSCERTRVWVRVDEHQLIRAELTATPLADASGQTRSVLVRTEASRDAKRRRELGEPIVRHIGEGNASRSDILQLKIGVPLLRVERESATIAGANEACAQLLDRPTSEIVGLPLTELFAESDRRVLIEQLAADINPRSLDMRLLSNEAEKQVQIYLTPDPSADSSSTLVTVIDQSHRKTSESLRAKADALSHDLVRNASRLSQLEAFFDRAPIGLALLSGGQVVRSNRAFDVRPESEINSDLDSAQRGESSPGTMTFRLDDSEHPAFALVIGRSESPANGFDAVAPIVNAHGGLALLELSADGTLTLRAGGHPLMQTDGQVLAQIIHAGDLEDLKSATEAIRTGQAVEPLQVRLVDGGFARVGLVCDASGKVLFLLEDETAARQEVDRLTHQVQQQADLLAELQANASAIDPEQFTTAISNKTQLEAQLSSLVGALGAGYFTWDINSGKANADERAAQLLAAPSTAGSITGLLAAATLDERRAFEQCYFDAVSGNRVLDLKIHIGADRRPLRLIGHVSVDQRDGVADPQQLSCVVLDQQALEGSQAKDLERALAIRTAELNAIFETSRDAIRILSDGTLRHNSVAAELFGESISSNLEGAEEPHPNPAVHSTRTPIQIDGHDVGVVSISADHSDSIQLRSREAEINALLANTGVAIALLDEQQCFRDVNSAFCALTGRAAAQVIRKPLATFVLAEDGPTLESEFDAVNSGELQSCTSDVRLIRRDGSSLWVHLTVTKPREDSGGTTIVLAQDIQELRDLRALREELVHDLSEARSRYDQIAATVQNAVLRLTPDGQLAQTNDIARTLFALDGHQSLSHLQFVAPETGNTLREPMPWRRHLSDRATAVELKVIKPDGESFVGRFNMRADENGNVVLSVADVTRVHVMQEELQKAYARIVESHTLLQSRTKQLEGNFVSAVQQLGAAISTAYGSAKALRNDTRLARPLSLLASRVVDSFRVHRRLVQYYTASATSRSAPVDELVDVHAMASEAATALAERFSIAGRLELALEAAQHRCRVDGALLRHAFWSIFAHAVSQAGKTAATVTSSSLTTARGEGKLRIDVQWPGSNASTAELNLADALIQSCGGAFAVNPTDTGMMLTVELDLAPDADSDAGIPSASKRHVLLVEDHESTARVLRRQLERLGCIVSQAGDLASARTVLEDRSDVDLLVCDLTLPDEDLEARITSMLRTIDLPAIALRSYGGVEEPEHLVAMGFVDHIDKPVDLNALSAVIARFASAAGE